MVFFMGDLHGQFDPLVNFIEKYGPTRKDTLVLLGDVGVNYYGGRRDNLLKAILNDVGIEMLCIHGNHERRPTRELGYVAREWNGGMAWHEPSYPNLIFAKDGEIYTINGMRYLVIGGAYSVDKYYRLERGYGWWPDEQPSDEIKAYVEQQIAEKDFDIVLSHTCPHKYEPTEMFLTMIDQSTVDKTTEEWLDSIEERIDYLAWFCGHWHTDKRIDKMHFLFHGVESDEQFKLADPGDME